MTFKKVTMTKKQIINLYDGIINSKYLMKNNRPLELHRRLNYAIRRTEINIAGIVRAIKETAPVQSDAYIEEKNKLFDLYGKYDGTVQYIPKKNENIYMTELKKIKTKTGEFAREKQENEFMKEEERVTLFTTPYNTLPECASMMVLLPNNTWYDVGAALMPIIDDPTDDELKAEIK